MRDFFVVADAYAGAGKFSDALYFANAGLNLAHRLGDRESLLEGTRRRLAYATKQSQAEASARPIE